MPRPPRLLLLEAVIGSTTDVILLSLSYVSEGYLLFMFISWLYIYLVEVRGFSLQNGGFVASLPWIAAIGATPLGGFVSDRLTARHGRARGARMLIMTGYTLSGVLLLAAAMAPDRTLAVAALCISLGSLYLAESSFWAMATSLAKGNAGAVAGFMNTIGILGGIASNAAVPLLVAHFGPRGWIIAFSTGTAMGLFCSGIWLFFGKRLGSPITRHPPFLTYFEGNRGAAAIAVNPARKRANIRVRHNRICFDAPANSFHTKTPHAADTRRTLPYKGPGHSVPF